MSCRYHCLGRVDWYPAGNAAAVQPAYPTAFPNQPVLETILPEQTLTSIVIYPLYHHVTGSTIHQGEIN